MGFVTSMLGGAVVTYGVIEDLGGRQFPVGRSCAAVLRSPLPATGVALCWLAATVLPVSRDWSSSR